MNEVNSIHRLQRRGLAFATTLAFSCSSISAPYSILLNETPDVIETVVGCVEAWQWNPHAEPKGIVYMIPGFPGSSLENAPLGQALLERGYCVRFLNPPGHGRTPPGADIWSHTFPLYGLALDECLGDVANLDEPSKGARMLVAHSAGAEMVLWMLLSRVSRGAPPGVDQVVLINPWLPSLSNHLIPWTSDDESAATQWPPLIRLFGPLCMASTHRRLFASLDQAYLDAHERLTESFFGFWPFTSRFTSLVHETARTQRDVLRQGLAYELAGSDLNRLDAALSNAKVELIVLSSSGCADQIVPASYRAALERAFELKLPQTSKRFATIPRGGHMLQVEEPFAVLAEILASPTQ